MIAELEQKWGLLGAMAKRPSLNDWLLCGGLVLTLLGAGLLFFYGLPYKEMPGLVVQGSPVVIYNNHTAGHTWQPAVNAFLFRARILNGTGFGFVVVGTLLQIIAVYRSMRR